MQIDTITTQIRNDLYGFLKCEWCGHRKKFAGYDDDNYHGTVIPNMKCSACGKSSLMTNQSPPQR